MNQGIKDLLSSKKFLAAIVAVLCWVGLRFGISVDPTQATEAIAPLIAFIVGQGIADHGKEAAIVSAQADGKGPVLAVAQAQAKDAGK